MQRNLRTQLIAVISGVVLVSSSCSSTTTVSGSERTKVIETVAPTPDPITDAAEWFHFTEKEMVLALTSENTVYREQHPAVSDKEGKATRSLIAKDELPGLLKRFMDNLPPDKRIVYLKVAPDAVYGDVIQVIDAVRKADIDKVGLVAVNEDRAANINAAGVEIRLPAEPKRTNVDVKPNPLTLVASLSAERRLTLNNEDLGTISNPQSLENRLKEIFDLRADNGVFRAGSYEVEKTVFIKAPRSVKYNDVLRLISSVKRAGSDRIGIKIDGLP